MQTSQTIYLQLLQHLVKSEDNWNKYYDYLDFNFIKTNFPDLYKLCRVIEQWHDLKMDSSKSSTGDEHLSSSSDQLLLGEMELILQKLYPQGDNSGVLQLCKYYTTTPPVQESLLQEVLTSLKLREQAAKLAEAALLFSDGSGTPDTLVSEISTFTQISEVFSKPSTQRDDERRITDNLEELLNLEVKNTGLRWRMPSLNRNLGSLRIGDFGWLFARPETGKTTFIASEATHMALQCTEEHPVLWLNNEDRGSKVMLRAYQAHFGVTVEQLFTNVQEYRSRFESEIGKRLVLIDDESPTIKGIEKTIQLYSPGLIIIDQLDKVGGFTADRADLELAAIYQWARAIAKQYCPVIGVCQASASGDGRKWLTMNDVDNSKTGKQAEADWILGIGKTYDSGLEGVRYLHLCKNKLMGDKDHDPTMRHGKWEVKIDQDRARYVDFD